MRQKTKHISIGIVVVLVFGAGTAVGVSMTGMDFNPLEPGQGNVPDSSLTIESSSLSYSGLDTDGATLKVNNTDTADHTGDVHIAVKDANGNTLVSDSKTGVSFAGNDTVTSVSLSFTATNVSKVDSVEVRIEETG